MQGMQSNSTPKQWPDQRPEPRVPNSSLDGSLDAVKRAGETQKDGREGSNISFQATETRPNWLRRWAGEARRETELQPTRQDFHSAEMPDLSRARSVSFGGRQDDPAKMDAQAVADPSNGHTGHSIEAAFDFETVFHFETDLEAEATGDWLDLSGDRGSLPAANERDQLNTQAQEEGVTYQANSGERSELPHNPLQEPSAQGGSASEDALRPKAPDPKAVRAAIFRLAQQSHTGAISKSEAGASAEAGAANPTSFASEDNFADVARQIWGEAAKDPQPSPEIVFAESSDRRAGICSSDESDRTLASNRPHEDQQTSEHLESQADLRGTQQERAEAGVRKDAHLVCLDVAGTTSQHQSTVNHEPRSEAPLSTTPASRKDASVPATLAYHFDSTTTKSDGDAESQGDRKTQFKSASLDGAVVGIGPLSNGLAIGLESQDSFPNDVRETVEEYEAVGDRASDGPALAHDAGNLLSALKLYSELLALSGVLYERHKHYAKDLKLLASRSEVLIDRLLASCSLAGQEAEHLLQKSVHHGLADATDGSGLLASNFGQNEPWRTSDQPSGEALPLDAEGSDAKIGKKTSNLQDAGLAKVATVGLGRDQKVAATSAEGLYLPGSLEGASAHPMLVQVGLEGTKDNGGGLTAAVLRRPDPLNLVDLLTRWGSLLSMIARGSVEVKFGSQAALPIWVAEEAMERILVNLVHNARKATSGGGAIRIGVGRAETRRAPHNEVRARPGNRMVLTVDDSGCGMSEGQITAALGRDQLQQRAAEADPVPRAGAGQRSAPDHKERGDQAERFDQAAKETSGSCNDQGATHSGAPVRPSAVNGFTDDADHDVRRSRGMGLQIVRQLVSASGGDLAIFSRIGVGTRIEIQWPTEEQAATLGRIPPASVAAREDNFRSSRGERRTRQPSESLDDYPTQRYGREFSAAGAGSSPAETQQENVAVEGAIAC